MLNQAYIAVWYVAKLSRKDNGKKTLRDHVDLSCSQSNPLIFFSIFKNDNLARSRKFHSSAILPINLLICAYFPRQSKPKLSYLHIPLSIYEDFTF